MKIDVFGSCVSRTVRFLAVAIFAAVLAGCNIFSAPKMREEPIIPAASLYQKALDDIDRQYFQTAIKTLEQLDRQHPTDPLVEKSKLMQVFAKYRAGRLSETILAADRYMALFPRGKDAAYVLYLKGNAYFAQIKDITRDQQLSRDAIDTYNLVISTYPESDYAKDARDKLLIAYDQLAGKEMSVGRYYLGNGQYTAAVNRFRMVVEKWQTSTHIEEALYRLTEAYLSLGLTAEATMAAAVLGHNYPASDWYQKAFALLSKQGLAPAVNNGSWMAGLRK